MSTAEPTVTSPTASEKMGMKWWNECTHTERAHLLTQARAHVGLSASVADAWRLWQAGRIKAEAQAR